MSYSNIRIDVRDYFKKNRHLFNDIQCDCHLTRQAWRGHPYVDIPAHAISCIYYLERLCTFEPEMIREYVELESSITGGTLRKEYVRKLLALLNGGEFDRNSVLSVVRSPEEKHHAEYVNHFLCSSVVVESPDDFPIHKGIYLVRFLAGNTWKALYVGKSENIKNRWKQHHRMPEIKLLQKMEIKLEFRYLAETPLVKLNGTLEQIESQLIAAFKPKLNNTLTMGSSKTIVG